VIRIVRVISVIRVIRVLGLLDLLGVGLSIYPYIHTNKHTGRNEL
jgi:hypothetical protein